MFIFEWFWVEKLFNEHALFFIHPNEKVINK